LPSICIAVFKKSDYLFRTSESSTLVGTRYPYEAKTQNLSNVYPKYITDFCYGNIAILLLLLLSDSTNHVFAGVEH